MTDEEKLGALATLSNGVADALATSASPKMKKQAIDRLVKSYGAQFKALDGKTMDTLIAGAETELHEHSKTFKLDLEGSTFATGLSEFKADADRVGQRRPHQQRVRRRRPGGPGTAGSARGGGARGGAHAGAARGHEPARHRVHARRRAPRDPRDDLPRARRGAHARVLPAEGRRRCRRRASASAWASRPPTCARGWRCRSRARRICSCWR